MKHLTRMMAVAVGAASAMLACSGGAGSIGGGDGGAGSSSGSGGKGGGTDVADASGSGGSSGGNMGSSGGGTNGASLTIASATTPASVGGLPTPSGTFFLVVALTLKNTGAPRPLSVNPVLFSLQTSQSLLISAAPAVPSGACNASVSIASSGQDSCSVVFEVPTGQTPTTLVYNDHLGDQAMAPVPTGSTPSGACQAYAASVSGGKRACQQCLLGAIGIEDAGSPTCASAADSYRVSCQACATKCDPLNGGVATDLCSCEATCDDAQCRAFFQTSVACLNAECSAVCP